MTEAVSDDLDALDAVEETGPLRRCIVTGDRLPREEMLRFVVGPDGRIVPDLAAAPSGRGRCDARGPG